jgi:hypothetical protein
MWEPRRLTTLCASTACYRDSFTFTFLHFLEDSAILHPDFTTSDFATAVFYRARLSALRPTPNFEGHVPVFRSPCDRVVQLYPQTPGSLLVAFYDSYGYGGGVLTRLHTGYVDVYLDVIIFFLFIYVIWRRTVRKLRDIG